MLIEFLKSKSALAILGLPGLALILAYSFYVALLKAKVIRPLRGNQGFIILMTIITYFAGVTVFFGFIYRPNRAPAQPTPAPPVVVPSPAPTSTPEDRMARLMGRARLGTPIESYTEALGQPVDVADDGYSAGLKNYRYEDDDGRGVQISKLANKVIAISAFDPKSELPVPGLAVGWQGEDGRQVEWSGLSDVTLAEALRRCDWSHGTYAGGRGGIRYVGPCYLGSGGSYNHFTFVFGGSKADERLHYTCWVDLMDENRKLGEGWLKKCKAADQIKPVGFFVSSGPAAVNDGSAATRIEPEDAALTSFFDYLAFGE